MPESTHTVKVSDEVYVKVRAFQHPRETLSEGIGRLISNNEGIIKFVQQVKESGAWKEVKT